MKTQISSFAFDIPNVLLSIRHLRQNQARGIAYIFHRIKKDPRATVTASKLADALQVNQRTAQLMCYRLAELGYGHVEVRTYNQATLPAKIKYAWSKNQHYFKVLHFHPSIDAFKRIFGDFLKKHFSPIILNKNNTLNTNIKELILAAKRPGLSKEQKRDLIVKFIEAKREDLWKYFTNWWAKRDEEPKMRKLCEEMGVSPAKTTQILHDMFDVPFNDEMQEQPQTIHDFFITPKIEDASEELEHVIATMEDLEAQREVWTDKQRCYWFGLKSKYKKLCLHLKGLLSSVVRYHQFIAPKSLVVTPKPVAVILQRFNNPFHMSWIYDMP